MTRAETANADSITEPGAFTLDEVLVVPSHNEMEARGRKIRLQPKVMEVLCYLARNQQRVISNDELTEHVWQGRVVTPGSVQKSINLLRKAFARLVGEREVVVHFSKRGYQLQILPVFLEQTPVRSRPSTLSDWAFSLRSHHLLAVLACLVLLLLILSGSGYWYQNRHTLFIDKSHQTDFSAMRNFGIEAGRQRLPEPHSDNQHLAYIVDTSDEDDVATESSYLVIHDGEGGDWWFAGSSGSWRKVAWSPSGRQLLAVELVREASGPLHPGFHSTAAQLFDLHVFEVDLEQNVVQSRHRLSHWHGHINSVTWWDEDIIELVGKQGEALVNQRYRYSLTSQQLSVVEPLGFVINPAITRVQGGRTAVASLQQGRTRIDFLDRDQAPFASYLLDYVATDFNWIPDGSGVLVYSAGVRSLGIVYRNGRYQSLDFPFSNDSVDHDFRYSADGQRILFTREKPRTNLWMQSQAESAINITRNSYWNYAGHFSPSGDRIVYVSVRNNQPQLWLVESGQERRLSRSTLHGDVRDVLWSRDGEHVIYRSGDTLYRQNIDQLHAVVLWRNAQRTVPLSELDEGQALLVVSRNGGARNLWRIDTATGEERQLTFGSLGSVAEFAGNAYFQYTGQPGLWRWRGEDGALELITRNMEPSSRILRVDQDGVYYVTGSECHESDVYRLDHDMHLRTTVLSATGSKRSSVDFHPSKGVLFNRCRLSKSDIMTLE